MSNTTTTTNTTTIDPELFGELPITGDALYLLGVKLSQEFYRELYSGCPMKAANILVLLHKVEAWEEDPIITPDEAYNIATFIEAL